GNDENLAIADLACAGGGGNRLDRVPDQFGADSDLDPDLGEKGDVIFGTAIDFSVALLSPVALDLGDREAFDADGGECFAHRVELEWLDDCHDELHQEFPVLCGLPRCNCSRCRSGGAVWGYSSGVPVADRKSQAFEKKE